MAANSTPSSSIVRFIIPVLVFLVAAFLAYRVAFNLTSGGSGSGSALVQGKSLQIELAASKGKPDSIVVADFTAEWCGPCQRMKRESWTDADVIAWAKGAQSVLEVDVDKDTAMAKEHRISAMPTTIVFKGGKEVDRNIGYLNARDLLAFLKDSAKK